MTPTAVAVAVPPATATEADGASVEPTVTRAALSTLVPTITLEPTAAPTQGPTDAPPPPEAMYSYPIGTPGRPLGDGFFIRHGYTVENTWFNPGYWHTGEDWYALEGDTAGAQVYTVAAGTVVYAGANYPGRVVIVEHASGVFSMYGHLDPALRVEPGQQVVRGAPIGTVLRRGDQTPNHLHFEIRTFLTTREVNGAAPRYAFRCGVDCPPGPGYWPFDAPDLPSALGWRNPTHLIARQAFPTGAVGPLGEVVVATRPISTSVRLWAAVPGAGAPPEVVGDLVLEPGARFPLLEIQAGSADAVATSARAYYLWYRIQLPDGASGWVQAAVPSTFETGNDGRPSTVSFNVYPAVTAAP